jgi:hypothetical protein
MEFLRTTTGLRSGWGNDTFHGLHRILGRDNQDITGARGALHDFDDVTHNVAQSSHA